MKIQRKKPRPLSPYNKQLLEMIDEFERETGKKGCDLREVAAWAITTGRFELPTYDVLKRVQRDLAKACQQDFILNEHGEPVRRRHVVKESQKVMRWFKMEDASPEQMRLSAQNRRKASLNVALQIVRDLSYYNSKYNPGDPIQMSFNFDLDVEERSLPTDYPETPPQQT